MPMVNETNHVSSHIKDRGYPMPSSSSMSCLQNNEMSLHKIKCLVAGFRSLFSVAPRLPPIDYRDKRNHNLS